MRESVNIKEVKERLRELILNNGLKWGEGLLNDGQIPKWIFDLREIILTPEGSQLASALLYEKIKNLDFDIIGGPSLAAEPLVASLVMHFYKQGKIVPGFIVRKQSHDFGLRKKIEGIVENDKRIVLIDDALNFGVSMLDAIEALRQEGYSIVKVITLLDFCKSGYEKLKEAGYGIDYLFNLQDFGLETNTVYNYKKNAKLAEIKIANEKEYIIKRLNEILNEEIVDFKIYKNLILAAYKEGYAYCFNQENYSIKWDLELGETIFVPIFVDNNVAVISAYSGFKNSMLFFISVENGKILKNIKMKGKVNLMPILHSDFYLVGGDKKLYCIHRLTYDILWAFETNGSTKISPVIDEDTEIIYLSSSDGNIYALNFDGKLIWKKHCGNIKTQLVHENKVILNSDISIIFCLDKNNGNLIWFHELKNEAFDMKIIHNKIMVGSAQGYMLLLNADTGKILDCYKIANESMLGISEHKKQLLVKLEDGKHYIVQA